MGIIPFPKKLSRRKAELIIKELAEQGAICWSKHCKNRMKEREITMQQILNCLIKGTVTDEPFINHTNGGGFETAIEKRTAGDYLRVIVCIKFTEQLLIATVY